MNRNLPRTNTDRVELLDNGRLYIAADFLPLLQANGLDSFEAIMRLPASAPIRSFPGRNTVRLELKKSGGESAGVFLKRYDSSYLSPWKFFLRAMCWPGAEDEAMREWEALRELRAAGFKTASPVTAGQEAKFGTVTRSFVMTAEITGGICAHDHVPSLSMTQRRNFARELGKLTKRFHDAGYAHKDYYLYHIFLVPEPGTASGHELFLIDLQRIVRPSLFQRRWRIKDLAALAYSALKIGVPRTDLMRFFHVYCSSARLDAENRALARSVFNRVAWLNQRRPKHDKAFEPMTRKL